MPKYNKLARDKILEEAGEFLADASKEELADILEAIYNYIDAENWDAKEIEDIRKKKNRS